MNVQNFLDSLDVPVNGYEGRNWFYFRLRETYALWMTTYFDPKNCEYRRNKVRAEAKLQRLLRRQVSYT